MARPVVLLHGYSDTSKGLRTWRTVFGVEDVVDVRLTEYVSLSNEVTIWDIAEGFDRALRIEAGLTADQEFDAIVHSTGMLVIRAWLSADAGRDDRRRRLKHLIGLAPATFGSPLAHQGRSWIGAIAKGNRAVGPDFMEAGDRILDALELGSSFLWELAHEDLIGDSPLYTDQPDTTYPFIFVGTEGYGGLRGMLVDQSGTDGTVRHAGVGLTSRKIHLDLTGPPRSDWAKRATVMPWTGADVPLVFLPDCHHSSILRGPSRWQVEAMRAALTVDDQSSYRRWRETYATPTAARPRAYQQFIVHALDDRGHRVDDWFLQLGRVGQDEVFRPLVVDTHAYEADPSFRCFHVDLTELAYSADSLWLGAVARSGTELVEYAGIGHERNEEWEGWPVDEEGVHWPILLDLSAATARVPNLDLYAPFTTTLIELRFDREPMPAQGENQVLRFVVTPEPA